MYFFRMTYCCLLETSLIIRARYSPITDNMISNNPLKNDRRTTMDVHPGTAIPIRSFLIIK